VFNYITESYVHVLDIAFLDKTHDPKFVAYVSVCTNKRKYIISRWVEHIKTTTVFGSFIFHFSQIMQEQLIVWVLKYGTMDRIKTFMFEK
jgi:hypothetical protein